MYSYEIKQYLQEHQCRITPLEFMSIINTSPQVKQVDLAPNSAIYTIITDDGLKMSVEIIEEPPIKKKILKRESE